MNYKLNHGNVLWTSPVSYGMNIAPNDMQTVEEKKDSTKKERHNFFKEVFKFALVALLIVVPIRVFIAQPFLVNGSSMSPAFETGDYLIIDEISYRFKNPERGDVIVLKYPIDPSKFFIKRIIGLPRETVRIENGKLFISKNNAEEIEILEDYVLNKSFGNFNLTLSDDEYFVMGDNRTASLDSRSWGPLQENLIRGKAFVRLLPITNIGIFPGSIE